MQTVKKSRILGIAFLIQAVFSLVGNAVFLNPLTKSGDIHQVLVNIAANPLQVRIGVLFEMITALGVIFLGVMLYLYGRKENEWMALTGMCFYILEGALLAASKLNGLVLLDISRIYMETGNPAHLASVASALVGSMNYNYTLSMLAFSAGAPFLYYLMYRARVVPSWMSLWGLITAICPCLVATVAVLMGITVPFAFYLPYAPFEFMIGIWILIKGVNQPLKIA